MMQTYLYFAYQFIPHWSARRSSGALMSDEEIQGFYKALQETIHTSNFRDIQCQNKNAMIMLFNANNSGM